MDTVTRRKFLLASVGGAAVVGGSAFGLTELLSLASSTPEPDGGPRRLVIVTLYGGNDGLNMVIPYADPAYHAARPELAYGPDKALHLDDALGLNPAMPGLKELWDRRNLAIIRGVGYPKPDHSHFRSMDIWQTASPAEPIATGWIGRWLDGIKAGPEVAVSFEPVLPPLLSGESRVGSCINVAGLSLPAGLKVETVAALGEPIAGEPPLQARAAAAFRDMLAVDELIREAEKATPPQAVQDEPTTAATATGGQSALASQLTLVARCVEARVPTRVYSVSLGGFDTHAMELQGQDRLLKQLDEALTGFLRRMSKTPEGRKVTVVVYSEFGRRVRGNSSHGTDHGTAGPVLVMGPEIAGGYRGDQPSLTDLDDGDLKANVDFRRVFGGLLESVLDAEPARYLAGFTGETVNVFR